MGRGRGIQLVGFGAYMRGEKRRERAMLPALRAALRAGTLLAQNRWKELAPVRTGTYRRSIHTEVETSGGTRVEIAVGTNLTRPPYPVFLEFGTRFMAPRPSARPAFDQTLRAVLRTTQETFERLVRGRA